MSKIIIHQAFYGEVNRAHSKIHQTVDDPELTSFLIRFTDRPGSLTPGVALKPYLSGSAFKKYYVFSKTLPDPQASRSGMVITHVLITDIASLEKHNDLKSILSLLISEAPLERTNLEPIELNVEHFIPTYDERQPIYIQKSLSSLINGDLPILFMGDLVSFELILQKLWNFPIDGFRKQLKFRASFSPNDIDNSNNLTIVSIQKELLPKWGAHRIISDIDRDLVEITSHSEALFLGHSKVNPFQIFIKELDVNINSLQVARQCDSLFSNYTKLNELNDPDILRGDIRMLSKLSPNESSALVIKRNYLEKYKELILDGLELNVKGLRNISWDSFVQGEKNGKNLVKTIIDKAIRDSHFKHIEMLSEVSIIAVNETNKTWWHKTIVDSLKLNISKAEEIIQKSIWKLLIFSKDCCKTILSIIPSLKESEAILIQYLPKEVPYEIGKNFLLQLQKRKWYLLHAKILLKLYKPKEAVEKQLHFERSLSFDESQGVSLILKEIPDDEILAITLDSCNDKLIQELTRRILKTESLLNTIDLHESCWLNIWTELLNKNQSLNYGIKGKEQAVVFSVFDLALQGKQIDNVVFEKIANSTYSNISDYKNRQKVWSYIPTSYQDKFIEATADSIVEKLVKEEIDGSSIEEILADYITSKPYMTSFLSKNRSDIEPVLRLFESFSSHFDKFLSDYISYYQSQITEYQSGRLGSLILSSNYGASARSVYDKSRYYKSFALAYEVCKSLVKLNWFESLWSSPTTQYKSQYYPMEQPKNTKTNQIENLPIVVILTAIKEEYLAVREHLAQPVDATQKSTIYEAGVFEFNQKLVARVVIRECGPKNTNAAQETERAIQYFSPDLILFVGIAGSRKPKDFSIGDVVYPTMIYSYEGGKSEKESFSSRPDMGGTTFHLDEIAKRERLNNDWKELIKNEQSKNVKADLGVIASGEKLVEHYESGIGKILSKYFNDTSAVEMEGFGFAKAASKQGKEYNNMMVGVVRGISDIIGQPDEEEQTQGKDRRPDNAKQLASDSAAAFSFWLIYKAFP